MLYWLGKLQCQGEAKNAAAASEDATMTPALCMMEPSSLHTSIYMCCLTTEPVNLGSQVSASMGEGEL